jgi:hypothetical protein
MIVKDNNLGCQPIEIKMESASVRFLIIDEPGFGRAFHLDGSLM